MAINNSTKMNQRGMTFIEVLVALVILVTGIFGAVAMQAAAKKGSFDAMQRSLASSLAQDIIERMRSNDASPASGILATYNGSNYGSGALTEPTPRCDSLGNICTSTQRVTNDLFEWEQALIGTDVKNGTLNVGGLVDARGCILANGNTVTVAVSWLGRDAITDGAAGDTLSCGTASDRRRQILIQAFIF